jgi:hypothetical protein
MLLSRVGTLSVIFTIVSITACGSDPIDSGDDEADAGSSGNTGGVGGVGGGGGTAGDTPVPVCRGNAGVVTVSGPCGCSDDCNGTEICADEGSTGIPGGLCVADALCESDAACPAGTRCITLEPGVSGCSPECARTADCAAGRYCTRVQDGAPLTCLPLCQSDVDCPVLGTCDRYTGICGMYGVHPGEGEIGDPCETSRDCVSGVCLPDEIFPGGTCRAACSVERQGCPAGSTCAPIYEDDDQGWCLKSCESHGDCRDGYACHDFDLLFRGVSMGRLICAPETGTGECQTSAPSPSTGEPCGCDRDCDSGQFCVSEIDEGWARGACSRWCTTNADCVEGTECVGELQCMKPCETSDDCGVGRTCALDGDSGNTYCIPYCESDEDCPVLGSCDLVTHDCVAAARP